MKCHPERSAAKTKDLHLLLLLLLFFATLPMKCHPERSAAKSKDLHLFLLLLLFFATLPMKCHPERCAKRESKDLRLHLPLLLFVSRRHSERSEESPYPARTTQNLNPLPVPVSVFSAIRLSTATPPPLFRTHLKINFKKVAFF